jgi:hypothetical protein
MQAAILAAAGMDEDEPPEFVQEKNIIIPIGGGKYITIPHAPGIQRSAKYWPDERTICNGRFQTAL